MEKGYLKIIIGLIFLIGGISFTFKEDWLFAAIFIIIGIIYFGNVIMKKGNKYGDN